MPRLKTRAEARFRLFGFACAYCGVTTEHLYRDHVQPTSRGGPDIPENIVPACQRCNSSKGARPVWDWYVEQPFFSRCRLDFLLDWCPLLDSSANAAPGQ